MGAKTRAQEREQVESDGAKRDGEKKKEKKTRLLATFSEKKRKRKKKQAEKQKSKQALLILFSTFESFRLLSPSRLCASPRVSTARVPPSF